MAGILRHAAFVALCTLSFFLAGCGAKQATPPASFVPGTFVSASGRLLDGPALASALARADYVLVGETHDNPTDHKAQAALLDAAAGAGLAPAVGLEMLPRGRFDASLALFSRGGMTVDALPAALDWQRSWGYDFALYRPVFEAAARHGLPLYGLNIDNDLRKAVSRKGLEGLSATEARGLPLGIVFPLPAQRKELTAFFSAHGAQFVRGRGAPGAAAQKTGAGGEAGVSGAGGGASAAAPRLERFLLIQSIWDSIMAEQAARVRRQTGRPVIILAGGGHVEKGYGIAHRLRIYDPAATVLTVMPFSGGPPAGGADLFYFSPERKRFGLRFEDGGGGPVIVSVFPGSVAEEAGLKAGDAVTGAGGVTVRTAADLHRAAVSALARQKSLSLTVRRGGSVREFVLKTSS